MTNKALLLLLSLAASVGFGGAAAYTSMSADQNPAAPVFKNPFEYTFEVSGSQIFPNDMIKNDIVNNYRHSEYNVSTLEYELLDHHINASGVRINVAPSKEDDARTRLDLDMYAQHADVTGIFNRSYDGVELKSIYGIYDKTTDKVTVHVPVGVALSLIG